MRAARTAAAGGSPISINSFLMVEPALSATPGRSRSAVCVPILWSARLRSSIHRLSCEYVVAPVGVVGGVVGGWGDLDELVEDRVEWSRMGVDHDGSRPSHGGVLAVGWGPSLDYCSVIKFLCLQFYLGGV